MSVDVIKNMGHSVNARLKHIATVRKVSFDYFFCGMPMSVSCTGLYKAFTPVVLS